jgi:putative tricarboxylic transport membrane protein
MGGHVDVAVTPISGVVSYVQSGQIRALAVSSPTRQGGAMASVPTWKEQGVDAVFSSFRGVMGPRGLSREQVAYWEDALRRIVQSEEWKRDLDRNYWADAFLGAEETARDLKVQYEQYRPVMGELGLAKQ